MNKIDMIYNIIDNKKKEINVVIDRMIENHIEPIIKDICDKYQLDYYNGNGAFGFEFKVKDIKNQIYGLSDIIICIDYPVEWLEDTKQEMKDYSDDEWDYTSKDIDDYIEIVKEVIPIIDMLGEYINGYEIGTYCNDYES